MNYGSISKILDPNILGAKNCVQNFRNKEIKVPKFKNRLGPKQFGLKKTFRSEIFWFQKIFGSRISLVRKNNM